jgi:hypothetical protein
MEFRIDAGASITLRDLRHSSSIPSSNDASLESESERSCLGADTKLLEIQIINSAQRSTAERGHIIKMCHETWTCTWCTRATTKLSRLSRTSRGIERV